MRRAEIPHPAMTAPAQPVKDVKQSSRIHRALEAGTMVARDEADSHRAAQSLEPSV